MNYRCNLLSGWSLNVLLSRTEQRRNNTQRNQHIEQIIVDYHKPQTNGGSTLSVLFMAVAASLDF